MQKNLHTGSHMWLLSLCSRWELLTPGKGGSAGRKGNLPRRQLAQYTEEAEPPPCPGQASLFLAFLAPKWPIFGTFGTKIAGFRGFWGLKILLSSFFCPFMVPFFDPNFFIFLYIFLFFFDFRIFEILLSLFWVLPLYRHWLKKKVSAGFWKD